MLKNLSRYSKQLAWAKANPRAVNKARLRYRYELDIADYEEMLKSQNGRCKICSQLGKDVDHDHRTGKVRGLLCGNCNRALGLFREDIGLLIKAIRYLWEAE